MKLNKGSQVYLTKCKKGRCEGIIVGVSSNNSVFNTVGVRIIKPCGLHKSNPNPLRLIPTNQISLT